MSRTHTNPSEREINTRRRALVVVLATALSAVLLLGAVGGGAATPTATANNSSLPYYNNSSSTVNSSAWFAGNENVTLDSIATMATRLGPFIIGSGSPIPGGPGYSGPIVLGLVVAGIVLGAVSGTRIGGPGGAVVALVTTYGLINVGLAPAWLKVVVLLIVGSVAAVVAIRATR